MPAGTIADFAKAPAKAMPDPAPNGSTPVTATEQAIADGQAELAGLRSEIAELEGRIRRLAADGDDAGCDRVQVKLDELRRKAERVTIRLEGLSERSNRSGSQ